ncbi:MAG: hypothetical protein CFH10_02026 [Alphaproteobacteria bacterium MarineAlpha4_Bin2]|nr:MAG: hypothetical protein CFH10_02026 [Alphaproteobacteria bacterium MarineAlpha4_Bin2]
MPHIRLTELVPSKSNFGRDPLWTDIVPNHVHENKIYRVVVRIRHVGLLFTGTLSTGPACFELIKPLFLRSVIPAYIHWCQP